MTGPETSIQTTNENGYCMFSMNSPGVYSFEPVLDTMYTWSTASFDTDSDGKSVVIDYKNVVNLRSSIICVNCTDYTNITNLLNSMPKYSTSSRQHVINMTTVSSGTSGASAYRDDFSALNGSVIGLPNGGASWRRYTNTTCDGYFTVSTLDLYNAIRPNLTLTANSTWTTSKNTSLYIRHTLNILYGRPGRYGDAISIGYDAEVGLTTSGNAFLQNISFRGPSSSQTIYLEAYSMGDFDNYECQRLYTTYEYSAYKTW